MPDYTSGFFASDAGAEKEDQSLVHEGAKEKLTPKQQDLLKFVLKNDYRDPSKVPAWILDYSEDDIRAVAARHEKIINRRVATCCTAYGTGSGGGLIAGLATSTPWLTICSGVNLGVSLFGSFCYWWCCSDKDHFTDVGDPPYEHPLALALFEAQRYHREMQKKAGSRLG